MKKRKIVKVISGIFIAIVLILGGKQYMEQKKLESLYKEGFRLYEEQIGTYLIEHYSGLSKVEFSPIFIDGEEGTLTINVVPVVSDNYGNKVKLGGKVGNIHYSTYGFMEGLVLRLGEKGEKIIEVIGRDGELVAIQNYQNLPEFAKLDSEVRIDENMDALIKDYQLKGVQKSDSGSTNATVKYNTDLVRGRFWEWQHQ